MRYFLSLVICLAGAFIGQTMFESTVAIWMAGAITGCLGTVIMMVEL